MRSTWIFLAAISIAPPVSADVLVDYGINLDVGPGFNLVTGPTYASGPQWSQYQSFSVPDADGWNVDSLEVVVHTWASNDPDALIRLDIRADDGTGVPTGPSLAANTVLADYFFESGLPVGGLETADLSGLHLPVGDYVVIASAAALGNPALDAGWIQGTLSGPGSTGFNHDTGELFPGTTPLSMRINGTVVPEPNTLIALAVASLCTLRRR